MLIKRSMQNWLLLLAVSLTCLPESAHALLFGRLFGRNRNPVNVGFRRQPVFAGQSINRVGSNRFNLPLQPNDLFKSTGFANLVQSGNTLLERNSFGQVRRLVIDNAGILRGATEAATVNQLRDFYTRNLDKFRGNALNTVTRFLAANGGFPDARFTIDLTRTLVDPSVPPALRCEAALKTLNFFLNSIQTKTTISIPTIRGCPAGKVDIDLTDLVRRGVFSLQTISLMKQSDETRSCTGMTRLDKLVHFMMDPVNYYKAINMPPTERQLFDRFGIKEDYRTVGDKMLILNHESGVSPNFQRVIERQVSTRVAADVGNRFVVPSSCYRSLDTKDFSSGREAESRSVEISGINFERDASEVLCMGGNGFLISALYNEKGNLVNEAPAGIATSSGRAGAGIKAGVSCLDCHAGGFLGGSFNVRTNKPYTDYHNRAFLRNPNQFTAIRDNLGRQMRHQDFFVPPSTYGAFTNQDNQVIRAAIRRANAEMLGPDGRQIPLVNGAASELNEPVTARRAAFQLGTSEANALNLIRRLSRGQDTTSRVVFEQAYCNLRQGNATLPNEGQQRQQLNQDARDSIFRPAGRSGFIH